ncbi:hypothetical protein HNR78_002694 [Parageobacillus toebii NBRC 107807]|uniref:Uncharacterized protein n=1 Tax=Parageobacillus toebii NBRC 107807 TaxID=1223503 RepID=A0AA89P4Q7_9BACL|nr:hypothetical protein [Parageobacillus toebii]MBB3869797.1 hypothetical protein [Parageobacillus toebii NBRC 107807]
MSSIVKIIFAFKHLRNPHITVWLRPVVADMVWIVISYHLVVRRGDKSFFWIYHAREPVKQVGAKK